MEVCLEFSDARDTLFDVGRSRHERTYNHAWTKSRAGIWVMWADRLAFSHSERIWPGIGPRPSRWAQQIAPGNHAARPPPLVPFPPPHTHPYRPSREQRLTRCHIHPAPLLFLLLVLSRFFSPLNNCSPSISPSLSPFPFFPPFFFFCLCYLSVRFQVRSLFLSSRLWIDVHNIGKTRILFDRILGSWKIRRILFEKRWRTFSKIRFIRLFFNCEIFLVISFLFIGFNQV